jgi:hypothetical protein
MSFVGVLLVAIQMHAKGKRRLGLYQRDFAALVRLET